MITLLAFVATISLAAGAFLLYVHIVQQQQVQARLRRLLDLPAPSRNPLQARREQFNATDSAKQLMPQLAQAGLPLTPFDFHLARLFVGGLLVLLLSKALTIPWLWSLSVSVMLTPLGFKLLLRLRRGSVSQAVGRQLPEFVRMLANTLHAGLSIQQGLALVGRELPAPLGPLVRRVVQEIQLGLPLEEALDTMTQRVASRDLQFIVTTLLLQHEVGGNLPDALEQIATTLVARTAVEGEITTATAEQRYVAMVLPVVPLGGLLLLNMGHPGYIQVLGKPLGLLLLVVSLLLQVTGFVLINRAARIKV